MHKTMNVDKAIKCKLEELMDQPVVIRVKNFSGTSCQDFSDQMDKASNSGQPFVPIVIDSYGGEVYSLLEMVGKIETCALPCHTIVESKAMSCGAILFAMGDRRYMSPHATLMIHEVSSRSFGKTEEIKADAKETDRLNKLIFRIMSKNCGKKPGFFLEMLHDKNNADLFLTAAQAKKVNICTDIGVPTMKVKVTVEYKLEKNS